MIYLPGPINEHKKKNRDNFFGQTEKFYQQFTRTLGIDEKIDFFFTVYLFVF